jgi:16S rRNA (uracil1498-N3)-methyltransferase
MPSFYTPNLKINDKNLSIEGDEHHHISNVFRKRIGDEILLTSGTGLLAKAQISAISKKETNVEIMEIIQEKSSNPPIAVAFPLLKNKHDFLIVEKLTELGVKEFFPIITNRTVRTATSNTKEKFEKIAVAAIKQCDNAFLPQIHSTQKLKDLLHNSLDFQPFVALETGKHKNLLELASHSENPICLIIGPEGGFDAEEKEIFAEKAIPAFTLGNHILRAETAAIVSVSQLLSFYLQQNPEYY